MNLRDKRILSKEELSKLSSQLGPCQIKRIESKNRPVVTRVITSDGFASHHYLKDDLLRFWAMDFIAVLPTDGKLSEITDPLVELEKKAEATIQPIELELVGTGEGDKLPEVPETNQEVEGHNEETNEEDSTVETKSEDEEKLAVIPEIIGVENGATVELTQGEYFNLVPEFVNASEVHYFKDDVEIPNFEIKYAGTRKSPGVYKVVATSISGESVEASFTIIVNK